MGGGAGTFPVPPAPPTPVQGQRGSSERLGQGPRWGSDSGREAERIAGEGGVGIWKVSSSDRRCSHPPTLPE